MENGIQMGEVNARNILVQLTATHSMGNNTMIAVEKMNPLKK